MKNWKVNQVLSESWHQWEGGGYQERMEDRDYGGNIMYSCVKIEK
jgi:hypothetical protein